ncbi:MAG: flagellar basal body-associated FliL family protein [Verrucomicrobiales bacterium]|nr:flagellar basal body-associated FliL family protein [Verrucomicrobiales bacterium]
MADKTSEAGSAEAHKAEGGAGGGAAARPAAGGGGMGAWLPLIVTLVAMPALAFAATKFLIVPQINAALGKTSAEPAAEASGGGHGAPAASGGHGAPAKSGHGESGGGAKGKITVALNKMIVNVSGTMGTRYLCSSLTLVGNGEEFKSKAEEHRDQLVDLATSALSNKTIVELEKPGSRNQIRAELISVFNEALGENAVQEIYFTEFAIQ